VEIGMDEGRPTGDLEPAAGGADPDSRWGSAAGLKFFGTITASVSHELNNVISIIDQVAGLLEDQLAALKAGQPLHPERLQDVHGRIQKQTQRGIEIIKSLNQFAHAVDEPLCEFELAALMRNFLALTDRLAGLRRTRLEASYPATELRMTGNPFLLQQAVFIGLQGFLATARPHGVIKITVDRHATGVSIAISGQEAGDPGPSLQQELTGRQAELAGVLRPLAATSDVRVAPGQVTLALTFPAVPS
jgi:C4-dicarboxylate-specific signal transduction histidine kinase